MSIHIIGERGYLGSFLKMKLQEFNIDSFISEEYVINCAGLVSVELSEENPYRSYSSNAGVVLDALRKYPKAKIINFSSYYVYDEPGKLCDELSKTTDEYAYMKHKQVGEKYALSAGGVCFRLGKLYGHPDVQKQNRLTECLIKSDQKIALDRVLFNPTSLITVFQVVMHELLNKDLHGIFNVADDGVVSHYDYGRYVLEKLGKNTPIECVDRMPRAFKNYGNFTMDIGKIMKKIRIKPWTENMDIYLDSLKIGGVKC